MKTVCKKLFSLMLVALMLVSAVPFAASAEGETPVTKVVVNATIDGAAQPAAEYPVADTAEANELYEYVKADPAEALAEDFEIPEGATATVSAATVNGDTMTFSVTFTSPAPTPTTTYTLYARINVNEEFKQEVVVETATTNKIEEWKKLTAKGIADGLGLDYDKVQGNYNTPSSDAATSLTWNIWLTKADGNVGGGENGGNIGDGNIAEEVILKTDYCGNITANIGDKYLDVLPTPAKPGQEFAYWKSETHGVVGAATVVTGADNLTAYWKAPTKYSITFIDERGDEPDVVKAKQVAYGSEIGEMPVPAKRDGYVFMYWKINGKKVTEETVYEWQGDVTAYAHWKLESDTEGEAMGGGTATADGEVYLEIYTNGDTAALAKRVKITDLAKDNKITQAEVESVVKKYITAKKGYTLKYEGLFDEETWWWYTRDPETDGAKSIVVNRDGDDYVYVMVKNVKTVAADPSNPKTGDGIFAVMSVMMGSGAALVSLNELRKRKMI